MPRRCGAVLLPCCGSRLRSDSSLLLRRCGAVPHWTRPHSCRSVCCLRSSFSTFSSSFFRAFISHRRCTVRDPSGFRSFSHFFPSTDAFPPSSRRHASREHFDQPEEAVWRSSEGCECRKEGEFPCSVPVVLRLMPVQAMRAPREEAVMLKNLSCMSCLRSQLERFNPTGKRPLLPWCGSSNPTSKLCDQCSQRKSVCAGVSPPMVRCLSGC